jgi:DNA replicative helicase MCM subunit Mcm2 (Cdc46/Mcm family)
MKAPMRLHSIPKIQICVKSGLNMLQFRELTADTMNKLIRIPGIVISAPSLHFPTIEPLSSGRRQIWSLSESFHGT